MYHLCLSKCAYLIMLNQMRSLEEIISNNYSYYLPSLFLIDQYMAFGISGSTTSTNMVGADVVVTWINNDGPRAVDYYLIDRQQVQNVTIEELPLFIC